jgi:hypothetical protein
MYNMNMWTRRCKQLLLSTLTLSMTSSLFEPDDPKLIALIKNAYTAGLVQQSPLPWPPKRQQSQLTGKLIEWGVGRISHLIT